MKILAIESSCDETAASIVENGKKILSNVVSSSIDIHAKTGGIIPENAARQQIKSIIPVISKALESAFSENQATSGDKPMTEIDAIAVTAGPGLIGSLLVGVETAKTLAVVWDKPIVCINHLLGHIYANWLGDKQPKFPVLALVVSGGHTDLVLMKDHGKTRWIGGTRDDAAGEAFDKTARLLGLAYPGGPSIAASAAKFKIHNSKFIIRLPRPMINEDNFDFSFSGLKTAVIREIEKLKKENKFNESSKIQLAHEVQEAISDVLVEKTTRAVETFKPKSLLLAGGVAANSRLREKFGGKIKNINTKTGLFIPPIKLCTDNATYIASCAFFNFKPQKIENVYAQPELSLRD